MTSTPQMIYKLMILYFLDSVNFPLSNAVISDYILDKGYTDYFTIQTALSELCEDGLIDAETSRKSTCYQLTDDGKQTLDCFHYELSPAIKNEIKEYLKEHFNTIIEMLSISSDYTRIRKNEYLVTMKITERDTLITEVKITVASEEAARACCLGWEKNSSDIYSFLVKKLM